MRSLYYVGSCVSLDGSKISDMQDIAKEITLTTFVRNLKIPMKDLNLMFGYTTKNLTLKTDYHVRFFN